MAQTPGNGSGSAFGVTATGGSNGSVTLTLNDTDVITSGSTVDILIGSIANYQAAGLSGITNPNALGSYPVTITTTTATNTPLDTSIISIATTIPVGVGGTFAGNIVASPTFSPASGTYANSATVTLSTTTPGATIYYTTDGSTPTTSSTVYTGALNINQSTVIQAIAAAAGYADSSVSTAGYTITVTSPGGEGGGGPIVIPPYIPPAEETIINGGAGGVAYGRCSNGSSITLTIPAEAWSGVGYVTLSCLPYSTFENKTGAVPGAAIADTLFGISITDSTHRSITTSRVPITAIITYTQGQYATLTQPFITQEFNTSRWHKLSFTQDPNTLRTFNTAFTAIGSIVVTGLQNSISCAERPADLNCDTHVNLIDLSILLYWWRSAQPGIRADINKDGIVNLIDFSILLYWWTG